ncbi:MAG: sensor histidine kinase, partial [Draconibacterium sp.]|nr:sensor histidine kinase [Draconibacterium sp.]
NGVLKNEENACKCLSEAYEKKGDFKNSFINDKLYKAVKDSIFNGENIKKITRLEMQYTYDKEKELQNLISRTREKEHRNTINILVLGLLSFLLISGLLYTLNRSRRKLNIELEGKNSQLLEALSINETLLKETHHRVKNNLQIISSLLNMQSKFLDDSHTKDIVIESQNRIKSMSLIHQKLYQGSNLTSIESETYFNDLINSLILSYGINTEKIKPKVQVENLLLDVDTAIPLGLILTELISNAFKYGVDKETGQFYFSFSKQNESELLITIRDNGPGIPENFDIHKSKSYGMKLVDILSKKLKADLVFNNKNGLEVVIKIHRFKIVT